MNNGVSFLLGDKALKNSDDDVAGWNEGGGELLIGGGLELWLGYCSCLRLCIRLISAAILAAICSEM